MSEKREVKSEKADEDVTKAAKLAIKLHREYSKASMAMALAQILKYGDMLRIGEITREGLDRVPDLKLQTIKQLAEGKL